MATRPLRIFREEVRGRKSPGKAVWAWLAALVMLVGWLLPAAAAGPGEPFLENLQYRVNAWVWGGAAKAGIILKSLGGGRYQAELAVEPLGILAVISGHRLDRFQTEMAYQDNRLVPLIYREETRRRGKYRLKEYRFDYDRGRLELWQYHKGKGLLHKWETSLKEEPIYDPLSAFYNFRLGALGSVKAGETLKVTGIPYPHPEEIVIGVGPAGPEGRKIMVSLINRAFQDQKGVVFVRFSEKGVPTLAWTRVLIFGKVEGVMLPESKPWSLKLPEMRSAPGAGPRGN
jgi:hypothetical protein